MTDPAAIAPHATLVVASVGNGHNGGMDVAASMTCDSTIDRVAQVVSDLSGYPHWLDIVSAAEPVDNGPEPAWLVTLRGQLGPLRRSKRIRMVAVPQDAPHRFRFVRAELDGRAHSPWTMQAELDGVDGQVQLTIELHYGGSLWIPLLDRVLADEIVRAKPRLAVLLAAQ